MHASAVRRTVRGNITAAGLTCAVVLAAGLLTGCDPATARRPAGSHSSTGATGIDASHGASGRSSVSQALPSGRSSGAPNRPAGQFTMAFAGDVHFTGRTRQLLARDPATAFGASAAVLGRADLTMVNLETAIAVGGRPENKTFTFQAPPMALTALRDAGVDVATMANNHGADYGAAGLEQTLAAIAGGGLPGIGIGRNAPPADTPFYRTGDGVRLAGGAPGPGPGGNRG